MKEIEWDGAVVLVARATFGKEWVSGLTHRQWWLIDAYQAPHLTSFDNDAKAPLPQSLRPEFEHALDRASWMDNQDAVAREWLLAHGYVEGARIDRGRLENLIAKQVRGEPLPRRRGRRPSYDWGAIENTTDELMTENGDFSVDDPAWNAQARLEEKLNEMYGVEKTALREQLPGFLKKWRDKKLAGK